MRIKSRITYRGCILTVSVDGWVRVHWQNRYPYYCCDPNGCVRRNRNCSGFDAGEGVTAPNFQAIVDGAEKAKNVLSPTQWIFRDRTHGDAQALTCLQYATAFDPEYLDILTLGDTLKQESVYRAIFVYLRDQLVAILMPKSGGRDTEIRAWLECAKLAHQPGGADLLLKEKEVAA